MNGLRASKKPCKPIHNEPARPCLAGTNIVSDGLNSASLIHRVYTREIKDFAGISYLHRNSHSDRMNQLMTALARSLHWFEREKNPVEARGEFRPAMQA
jgi:hypothetical protein